MVDATVRRQVGQRIATARRAAGMTHAELAARLGWPRDTLIHYEHGRRALSVERLVAIAAALDIHPAVLLIADADLRAILHRLVSEPDLRAQVHFFLETLESG